LIERRNILRKLLIFYICYLILYNSNNLLIVNNFASSNNVNVKWNFESENNDFSSLSPCIADLDGNGIFEIIACSSENILFVLDSFGKIQWIYKTKGQIIPSPSVADIDDDGRMEILFADYYFLYCLDHTGRERWRFEQNTLLTTPCIADIDGDGVLEILTTGLITPDISNIYCLNNLGEVKWSKTLSDFVWGSASVADLDNDGYLDILFGSNDNNLYCLDHTGEEKWHFVTNERVGLSPSIADIDDDGTLEILFASFDKNVYCLNHTGGKEWSLSVGNYTSHIALADIDNDNTMETIFCSNDGRLYCLDHLGLEEWSIFLNGYMRGQSIVDIDGDGTLEIVGGTDSSVLYCINHLGNVEWQNNSDLIFRSSPCVADLENDGSLEIIIGASSYLNCFTSSITHSSGALPWYRYRGSIFSTGNIDSDSDYLDDVTEKFYKTDKANRIESFS